MHLNATFGTLLAPLPLLGRRCFRFLLLGGPILDVAGLVGPLERTLRMDAVARIGGLTADRTKVLDSLRDDGDGLEDAHMGSKGENARSIPAERWGRRARVYCTRWEVPCAVAETTNQAETWHLAR